MAELIYPTSEILYGPWLIDHEALEAFDRLFDQESERIKAHAERKASEELERDVERLMKMYAEEGLEIDSEEARKKEKRLREEFELRYGRRSEFKRNVSIQLKGKRIEVESFSEASRQPEVLGEIPRKFDAHLQCGEVSCTVSLTGNLLSFRASPENSSEGRELFTSLRQWVATIEPPPWLHLWKKLNGLQWPLWLMVILVIVFTMGRDPKDEAKKAYQEQAHQILKSGVTQEQQAKAIEVLLALQSEYVPSAQPTRTAAWFLFLFYGGLVMCVVSTILPSAVLGVGRRGQNRIRFWRKWIWFVFIAVPGFVLVNIVLPYVTGR